MLALGFAAQVEYLFSQLPAPAKRQTLVCQSRVVAAAVTPVTASDATLWGVGACMLCVVSPACCCVSMTMQCFSATFPAEVAAAAADQLVDPVTVRVDKEAAIISPAVVQRVHVCAPHKKPRKLMKFVLAVQKADVDNKVRQRR